MVAERCEAPEHGSMHLLTWSFSVLVTELHEKANAKHAVEAAMPQL